MKKRFFKNNPPRNAPAKPAAKPSSAPPQPVNVVDGVPDAVEKPSRRRLGLVLLIFAGWVAFLMYCLLAARV